mmetsp:Transcript_51574/g.144158  ORF Transcript_51574/g.144158 Transcript_51574/m.144158 type:complete len:232 (-) Transcript_51574:1056-1751(-)
MHAMMTVSMSTNWLCRHHRVTHAQPHRPIVLLVARGGLKADPAPRIVQRHSHVDGRDARYHHDRAVAGAAHLCVDASVDVATEQGRGVPQGLGCLLALHIAREGRPDLYVGTEGQVKVGRHATRLVRAQSIAVLFVVRVELLLHERVLHIVLVLVLVLRGVATQDGVTRHTRTLRTRLFRFTQLDEPELAPPHILTAGTILKHHRVAPLACLLDRAVVKDHGRDGGGGLDL